jgi:3-hydroxyisobutyrate dehydrogenase
MTPLAPADSGRSAIEPAGKPGARPAEAVSYGTGPVPAADTVAQSTPMQHPSNIHPRDEDFEMTLRAGYIGLGNIGGPMASCWVKAGFETAVYDVVQGAIDELTAQGANAASTPRHVAEGADVIGICVRDDDDVRDVMLGDDGVLAGASKGAVVMIHSTIQPSTVIAMAEAGAGQGVAVIDAAITGGAARAVTGDLAIMLGGDPKAQEKVQPILDASAKSGVFHCGELGNGMKTKLCINLVTYLQWLAGSEGVKLAKASGLPPETLIEVGLANGQITPLMQTFLALHTMPEEARKSDAVQDLVRGHTLVEEKDLAWALQLARENGLSLPGAGLVSQMMARVYGLDDEDRR